MTRRFIRWLCDLNSLRSVLLILALVLATTVGEHHWWKWLAVGASIGAFTGTLPNRRLP